MPERPTKKWWNACVAGVSSGSSAYDPKRVCGAVWYRKPMSERRAIYAADERYGNWPQRAPFDPKEHEAELRELDLFIDNDRECYRLKKPFIEAVRKRLRKGTYDPELAPTLWLAWVTAGARLYAKEFGGDWQKTFPLPLRYYLAKVVAKHEHGRIERHEYD